MHLKHRQTTAPAYSNSSHFNHESMKAFITECNNDALRTVYLKWKTKQQLQHRELLIWIQTHFFQYNNNTKLFSELVPVPVLQVWVQRLRIWACYRLCVWRMFKVSRSIRSRSRQSASAIVLWAPLLFSQWEGSLLSCSFVRRTSCFWTESAKINYSRNYSVPCLRDLRMHL